MLKLSLIGAVLVAITVMFHAVGTTYLVRYLARTFLDQQGRWGSRRALVALMIVAIVLVFLHTFEIIMWAGTYRVLVPVSELPDFETAVYFSFVTFTTLGYGDITLSDGWRLLSGIQALNGILLVGWSTALMFAVVQKTWQADEYQQRARAVQDNQE
jgi:voltage-gated potassium channel